MRDLFLHGFLFLSILGLLAASGAGAAELPHLSLPKYRLLPDEVAVVINDRDPLSQRIGRYYAERRGIPPDNIIHVSLDPKPRSIAPKTFQKEYAKVLAATPDKVQAYVLTWTLPYRVACMSMTTAFAAGFDQSWCSSKVCAPTRRSPYFDSSSRFPHKDYGLRPSMLLAAETFAEAKALIDRGIKADRSWPSGTAYLLETSDRARSVRAAFFPGISEYFRSRLQVVSLKQDALYDADDILFYFTGRRWIEGLETLDFLPGAVADHLTSYGGRLTDTTQMTILAWLKAGATGSYGTVVEPCNLPGKFPHPGAVMDYYLKGATLVEAYWKSVAMPGEGLFVGEPLAAPFAGHRLRREGETLILETHALAAGRYRLQGADSPIGPFRSLGTLEVRRHQHRFRLPDTGHAWLKLIPVWLP